MLITNPLVNAAAEMLDTLITERALDIVNGNIAEELVKPRMLVVRVTEDCGNEHADEYLAHFGRHGVDTEEYADMAKVYLTAAEAYADIARLCRMWTDYKPSMFAVERLAVDGDAE